ANGNSGRRRRDRDLLKSTLRFGSYTNTTCRKSWPFRWLLEANCICSGCGARRSRAAEPMTRSGRAALLEPDMAMYCFQTSVHACPIDAIDGKPIALAGRTLATMAIPRDQLATPFTVSFEQAAEALEAIERLFFEPDGSFVWASS